MHSKSGMQFGGDSFEQQLVTVKNLTGGDTLAGGVYALDLDQADAATSGASDPGRAAMYNIKLVTANNINGILVVTEKIIKTTEEGLAVVSGPVKARCNGTVALTDRLKATAAQTYLAAASAAAGSTDIGIGKPLEINAAGPNVKKVLFNGISFDKVVNGAVS